MFQSLQASCPGSNQRHRLSHQESYVCSKRQGTAADKLAAQRYVEILLLDARLHELQLSVRGAWCDAFQSLHSSGFRGIFDPLMLTLCPVEDEEWLAVWECEESYAWKHGNGGAGKGREWGTRLVLILDSIDGHIS